MVNVMEIYKCKLCGNIVEVVHGGGGDLVCCGETMTQLKENTVDASKEKHVPVVEKVPGGYKVTVGSVPHPMEDKHYIEWIEVLIEGKVCRQILKPGQAAEAFFKTEEPILAVRELCNLHGLWKA